VRATALGKRSADFATSLNNLAELYQGRGRYVDAEALHRRALKVRRATFGKQHPLVAQSLNNLGSLYLHRGRYADAERLLLRSREVRRAVLGKMHADFAESLNNLGGLYSALGRIGDAEALYRQASDVYLAALGESHPAYAQSLSNLAYKCVARGNVAEGLSLMQRALAIEDELIWQVFARASESQRLAFVETLPWKLAAFLSVACQEPLRSLVAPQVALDVVLRRKAIVAEALAAQRDVFQQGRSADVQDQLDRLNLLRWQIARKTLAGPAPGEGVPAHKQTLDRWKGRRELIEQALSGQIPKMRLDQLLRAADCRSVARGLPLGSALIEFVRFDVFDFHAVPARGETKWKPARYLACVLPAREPDGAQMIDLGEAEVIDRLVAELRDAVVLSPGKPPATEVDTGAALRAAVFDKLVPALDRRTRLLLAPDGDLHRLPFEILPLPNGRLLIEEYQVSYLSCGRDVLRFGAAWNGRPSDPLVVADPAFNLTAEEASPTDMTAEVAREVSRYSPDLDRSLRFGPLKGTRQEGERVAEMLGVKPWLRAEALEARVKQRRSPRVLHLATHGFFLPDSPRDPNSKFREAILAGVPGRLSGPGMENPLLRSGLALAGANIWLRGGTVPPEAEDGLLTAEDVSGIDLFDTELVVLSACDTGLGEVRTGEGVFGLRRAFVLAGPKALVMSLWKVPDAQTCELMVAFHTRLLAGCPVDDALREAQKEMKKTHPDPYNWGAFICQGNPVPLSGRPPLRSFAED
jgi:CHAT domain-containing protein/tetratricopeptide (TPR) repeat protein